MNITLSDLEEIVVGKYHLHLVTSLVCDILYPQENSCRCIYLVSDLLTPRFRAEAAIIFHGNAATEKKKAFPRLFCNQASLMSVENLGPREIFRKKIIIENEIHLPVIFPGKYGLYLSACVFGTYELMRQHKKYNYLISYNAPIYFMLPILFAKYLCRKKIILDLEDDYSLRDGFWGYKIGQWLGLKICDSVVVTTDVAREKYRHLKKPISVVNGIANFSYLSDRVVTNEGQLRFVYAGSFDAVRGAELLPDLIRGLEAELGSNWRLSICGFGPNQEEVRELANGHALIHFYGYVDAKKLSSIMKDSHAGIVLQPPDSPFASGSFPSKVMLYARHGLPVFMLKNRASGAGWVH